MSCAPARVPDLGGGARSGLATMARSRCLSVILLLAAMAPVSAASAAKAWSLLPQPVAAHPSGRPAAEIANGAVVSVEGGDRAQMLGIARDLARWAAVAPGLHLQVAATVDAHAAIRLRVDPQADVVGDSGYRIVVDRRGISVVARTARGAFYGSVTAWQLLTPPGWRQGEAVEVAAGAIEDHPRFRWRGLLLDSGRHFQDVADIEKLIDWMSLNKLDVLLWHLTEDQGWRLDVPAYPELTRVGACRKAVGLDIEATGSADKPYCGFYSADQVREIVRHAAARFVTVVPGIDLPGHSQAAIAAYPQFGVTGRRPPVWTQWGISPWLLRPDEATLHFVGEVLDEAMRLFPSPYISIGGDEAAKDQWNASPEVRARMRELGLANMDQLQAWFTNRVAQHLVGNGRIPVGWDDELVAGATLPASEVVMAWHDADHGRVALEAIAQGHDVILASEGSLYLDHYQSDLPDEAPGRSPQITLRQVYDTALVPRGATAAQASHVLGVQAQLWTELMPDFAHAQRALFPRLAALSEIAWSAGQAHDWQDFLERMPAELARYRALGIDYSDGAFAPVSSLAGAGDGKVRVTLSNQTGFGTIRYTTDGSLPTAAAARYAAPLVLPLRDGTALRAATFAADGSALSAPRTQALDPGALLRRDGNELASCPGDETTRVVGPRTRQARQPVYRIDVGDMCWRWPQAPLDGVTHVALEVAQVAWRDGDEAGNAVVRPTRTAAGEFEIHADTCNGPLLATLPLASATRAHGLATLQADVTTLRHPGTRDLCIQATGDPRRGQWVLARMIFSKGAPQHAPRGPGAPVGVDCVEGATPACPVSRRGHLPGSLGRARTPF